MTVSPTKTSADASRKVREKMRAAALAWLNDDAREEENGHDKLRTLVGMLTRAWDDGFESAPVLATNEAKAVRTIEEIIASPPIFIAPPVESDERRGLYGKYHVTRRNDPSGKHDGCDYFVLDLTHDPNAFPALMAYASACQDKYPQLAADLRRRAVGEKSDELSRERALDKASCVPTTDFGCEARAKLAKARGALDTIRDGLKGFPLAFDALEELERVAEEAFDATAMPQPCHAQADVDVGRLINEHATTGMQLIELRAALPEVEKQARKTPRRDMHDERARVAVAKERVEPMKRSIARLEELHAKQRAQLESVGHLAAAKTGGG